MSDCFRSLEWVKYQLGFMGKTDNGVRKFLREHGVPVLRNRVLQSQVFAVWDQLAEGLKARDPRQIAEDALGR